MFDAKETDLARAPGLNPLPEPPSSKESYKDAALALRAGQGDETAFNTLYDRHRRHVESLCNRMVGQNDGVDLSQLCWMQVHKNIKSFKGESAFSTWLHRLSVNMCLMHFRKRVVKLERTVEEEGDLEKQSEKQAFVRYTAPTIDDKIWVQQAMRYLPLGYYEVLYYHDILGYEHEEIARILRCSVGTSKSQLHKARNKMRKILGRKKIGGTSSRLIERRYDSKLGIELPAMSLMDLDRGIDLAREEEDADDYEE